MNATTKVKLREIIPNLTCHLCKGYFIDATTIIECLHSFCKSCIVKHLEKSEYCPVCDVQLHSSKPLSSIRSDQMLQEIVYKLVPGLFQNEMENRRGYYKGHPDSKPVNQMDSGHVYNESYISSDDIIHLSLEYHTTDIEFRESTKRFIKCPAAVSISILKKLLQGKFDLSNEATIEVMYGERVLPDDFLLMDIAYKYSWTQNGKPLQLCYRVKGDPSIFKTVAAVPVLKVEENTVNSCAPVTAQNTAQNGTTDPITPIKNYEATRKVLDTNFPLPNTNDDKNATHTSKRRQSRGTRTNPLEDGKGEEVNTRTTTGTSTNTKTKKHVNGLTSISRSSENNKNILPSNVSATTNSKSKENASRKSLLHSWDVKAGMEKELEVVEGVPLPSPIRGRRKRNSLADERSNGNNANADDNTKTNISPTKGKKKSISNKSTVEIKDKEVQLRISENGVICARNASGEEKIIGVGDGKVHPVTSSTNTNASNSQTIPSCVPNGQWMANIDSPNSSSNTSFASNQSPKTAGRTQNHHMLIPQIAAKHVIGSNSPFPPLSGTATADTKGQQLPANLLPSTSFGGSDKQKATNTQKPEKKPRNKNIGSGPGATPTEKLTRASCKPSKSKNTNIILPISSASGSRVSLKADSATTADSMSISTGSDKKKLFRVGTKRVSASPLATTGNAKISKAKLAGHFNHLGTSAGRKGVTKNSNMETLKSFTKRLQEELDAQMKFFSAEITPTITPAPTLITNGPSTSSILPGQNPNQSQSQVQVQNQNQSQNQSQQQNSNLVNTNSHNYDGTLGNLSGVNVNSAEIQIQNYPGASIFSSKVTSQQPQPQQQQVPLGDKRHHQSTLVIDGKYSKSMSTPTKSTKRALSSPSPTNNSKVRILPKITGKDSPLLQQKILLPSSTSSPNSSPKKPPKFFKSRHANNAGVGVQSDLSVSKPPVNKNLNARHGYVGVTSEPLESTQQTAGVGVPLVNGIGSSSNTTGKMQAKATTSTTELPVSGPPSLSVPVAMSVSTPTSMPLSMSMSTSTSTPLSMTSATSLTTTVMTHQAQAQLPHATSSVVSGISQSPIFSIPNNSLVTTSSANGIQGHIIGQTPGQGSYRFPLSMGMNFPNGFPMNLVPFVANSYHGSMPFFSTTATSTSNVNNNTTNNLSNTVGVGATGPGGLKNISIPQLYAHPYFDFQNAAQIQSFAQNMNALNASGITVNGIGNGNHLNVLHAHATTPSSSTSTQNIQDMSFAKLNTGMPITVSQVQSTNLNTNSNSNPISPHMNINTNTIINTNTNSGSNTTLLNPTPASISSAMPPPTTAGVSGSLNPNPTGTGNTYFISNTHSANSTMNSVNAPSSSVVASNLPLQQSLTSNSSSSTNKSSVLVKQKQDGTDSPSICLSDSLISAQNIMLGIHNIGRGVNVSVGNFNSPSSNTCTSTISHNTIMQMKAPRKSNSPIKIGRNANLNSNANGNVSTNGKSVSKLASKTPEKQKMIAPASTATNIGAAGASHAKAGVPVMSAMTELSSSAKGSGTNTNEKVTQGTSNVKSVPTSVPRSPAISSSGGKNCDSSSVSADSSASINSTTSIINTNSNLGAIYNNNDANIADLNTSRMNSSCSSATAQGNNKCSTQQLNTPSAETTESAGIKPGTTNDNINNSSLPDRSITDNGTGAGSSSDSEEMSDLVICLPEPEPDPDPADPSAHAQNQDQEHCNNSNNNGTGVDSDPGNSNSESNAANNGVAVSNGGPERDEGVNESCGDGDNKNPAQCFNISKNSNVNNNILPKPKDSGTNVNVSVGSVSVVPTGAENNNLTISSVSPNVDVSVSQTEHSSTPSA